MIKLRLFLSEKFKGLPINEETEMIKEQMYEDLLNKYLDLTESGVKETHALNKVMDDFGDIEELKSLFHLEKSNDESLVKQKKVRVKREIKKDIITVSPRLEQIRYKTAFIGALFLGLISLLYLDIILDIVNVVQHQNLRAIHIPFFYKYRGSDQQLLGNHLYLSAAVIFTTIKAIKTKEASWNYLSVIFSILTFIYMSPLIGFMLIYSNMIGIYGNYHLYMDKNFVKYAISSFIIIFSIFFTAVLFEGELFDHLKIEWFLILSIVAQLVILLTYLTRDEISNLKLTLLTLLSATLPLLFIFQR